MFIQASHCGIYILQSHCKFAVHITVVRFIGIIGSPVQQYPVFFLQSQCQRIRKSVHRHIIAGCLRTGSHTHRQYQQHHCQNLAYTGRQSEVKTAALSQCAFHIEQAHIEIRVRFLILLNDALTVHQAESATFVLPQFLPVGRIFHTDSFGVIHFLAYDAGNIFRRQATPVIFNGYFHAVILLTGINPYLSSFRSIFARIFSQCIYHKESQCPVCLHASIGRLHFHIQLFHFKSPASFPQQFEEFIQFKCFNVQAQRTLLHLNPQSQNIIVLVNRGDKLVNILILLFFDSFVMDIPHAHQLVHLVQNTVNIRMNTVHNRQTSLFYQILPFVSGDVLFVDITLFFQPALFLAEGDGSPSVVQRPLYIRVDYLHHSLFIFPHALCEYQFSIFNRYIFCTE